MSDQGRFGFTETPKSTAPVECLGQTFESDEARRDHYLKLLAEELKDPAFRKTPGFPKGSDEDILRLSDPPYYTACPNPFLGEFVQVHGRPYDSKEEYDREPFASDTSAGKKHPIYTAHSYHSKIPHLAIMPSILHYTDPGDLVFDGFAGSGMTGVAARLCEQPDPKFKLSLEKDWKNLGYGKPQWGARKSVLMDLSPVANFIGYNLNHAISASEFEQAAQVFMQTVDAELGWMYGTSHADDNTNGRINYVVWSEVFTCPNCAGEVIFIERAYDSKTGKFSKEFSCPHCQTNLTTRSAERKLSTYFDMATGETMHKVKYVPIELEYMIPGKKGKHRKKLDSTDCAIIEKLSNEMPKDRFPSHRIPEEIYHYSRLAPKGVTHFHQFYLPRALHSLSAMWRIAGEWPDSRMRGFLKFVVEQCFWGFSLLARFVPSHFSQVNQYLPNVYYIPPCVVEISPWYILDGKIKRLLKLLRAGYASQSNQCAFSTSSSLAAPIPDNSIDYVYTDLPFGDFVPYGDLNLLIESWHEVFTDLKCEVLVDKKRHKPVGKYGTMMRTAFAELYRILKPGRWATIVFHNSKNAIWNVLQDAIGSAGFVIADARTMDRGTGSYRQYSAQMAVKADVVISAYKPNSELEETIKLTAGTEDGAWSFVHTHLNQLPVFVSLGGQVEVIAERQNYLLFDRMVAFHVQRGFSVPLSASEFYEGLERRFPTRDGMYFHPNQVAEYDKKRVTVKEVIQARWFISDESSAIQWLRQQLTRKPQAFQTIHPQFMKEISGWKKHENALELSVLLEQNFLRYDGKGEVPSQIHAYLSTNFKDLRNVGKKAAELKVKASNRWYVPDPKKESDLEKFRLRTLLKEFEEYRNSTKRKIKLFRTEAVRAGFKHCYDEQDYQIIVDVAAKLPEQVIQEDEKLLMYYDVATMRLGD